MPVLPDYGWNGMRGGICSDAQFKPIDNFDH